MSTVVLKRDYPDIKDLEKIEYIHLLQCSAWRDAFEKEFAKAIDPAPAGSKPRIWSWSMNAHGRLSHVTLWSGDDDKVFVFHLNFFLGKSKKATQNAIDDSLPFIENTLKVKPSLFLHDGESFDASAGMCLPFYHLVKSLFRYFMENTLLKYTLRKSNTIMWSGNLFVHAMENVCPELLRTLRGFFNISHTRVSDKEEAKAYNFNMGVLDGINMKLVLDEVQRLIPTTSPQTFGGIEAADGDNINGMKQTTIDIWVVCRVLFNRKPHNMFPDGDFRPEVSQCLSQAIGRLLNLLRQTKRRSYTAYLHAEVVEDEVVCSLTKYLGLLNDTNTTNFGFEQLDLCYDYELAVLHSPPTILQVSERVVNGETYAGMQNWTGATHKIVFFLPILPGKNVKMVEKEFRGVFKIK